MTFYLRNMVMILGLGLVLVVSAQAATAQSRAAIRACDRLAGHPNDKSLPGDGVNFSTLKGQLDAAFKACEAAARSGQGRQIFQLGRTALAAGQFERAEQLYAQAVEADHLQAMHNLSTNYYNGSNGVALNPERAVEIYYKLIAHSDPFGSWGVAKAAASGKGTPQNLDLARQFGASAYASGETRACFVLGDIARLRGDVISRDRAAKHYGDCLRHGHYKQAANAQLGLLGIKEFHGLTSLTTTKDQRLQVLERALEHLRLGRGTQRHVHDAYVQNLFGLFDLAVAQPFKGVRDGFDLSTNKAEMAQDVRWALSEAFNLMRAPMVDAIEQRAKAFPGVYSTRDSRVQVNSFEQSVRRYMDAILTDRGPRPPLIADDCLKMSHKYEGRYFNLTVRNTCRFSIDAKMIVSVRQVRPKRDLATSM